jgi:hypothetical protein
MSDHTRVRKQYVPITPEVEAAVHEMRARGRSYRDISTALNIGKTSVERVINGTLDQAGKKPVVDYALYRHFDAEGRLLYVGISENARVRTGSHAITKDWFLDVATTTYQRGFSSREELADAEYLAIKVEVPLWNLQHVVCGSKAQR